MFLLPVVPDNPSVRQKSRFYLLTFRYFLSHLDVGITDSNFLLKNQYPVDTDYIRGKPMSDNMFEDVEVTLSAKTLEGIDAEIEKLKPTVVAGKSAERDIAFLREKREWVEGMLQAA